MATGHILPGRGSIVTKFRSKSADPTMSSYRYNKEGRLAGRGTYGRPQYQTSPRDLVEIKRDAILAWNEELEDWTKSANKRPTTYEHSFYNKGVKSDDRAKMRPVSPTRRNKPHPKDVFMTCRLHKVPGYYDPSSAMGKEIGAVQGFQNPDARIKEEVYLVDALCPEWEQHDRRHLRHKYIGRPSTVNVMTYKDEERQKMKKVISDPWSAQAAEAWMKLAGSTNRKAVRTMVNEAHTRGPKSNRQHQDRTTRNVSEQVREPYQASVHRFLKGAGHEESRAAEKLYDSLESAPRPLPMSGPHFHITDYSKVHHKIHPKHVRTDFTIHPEWVP
ncbi:uncharacterized protein LOC119728496 [Patiria miniata]|uniref:Uncharacterized protein n=1 Tax=Patiria miniata TaxID=46514 RepID=A0A914A035_PATMI|nr:uncharacterized protein LOC119728496 [Patiria miniata]